MKQVCVFVIHINDAEGKQFFDGPHYGQEEPSTQAHIPPLVIPDLEALDFQRKPRTS